MHPTILNWLNGTTRTGALTIQRIVELVTVNGGEIEVTQFGKVTPDPSAKFMRTGLSIQEAVELTELGSFALGMAYLTNEIPQLKEAIMSACRPGTVAIATADEMRLLRIK